MMMLVVTVMMAAGSRRRNGWRRDRGNCHQAQKDCEKLGTQVGHDLPPKMDAAESDSPI